MTAPTSDPALLANLRKTLTRAALIATRPAACPQLSLYLFDPGVLQGPLSHDEAQAVVAEPAYWSFCWASGQVLAHYILSNKGMFADKVVADIGAGSGVVAIAAAKAGAKSVYACDIDLDALDACHANAHLNDVEINCVTSVEQLPAHVDIICAADLLYDRDNLALLTQFKQRAQGVVLADSRIKNLGDPDYQLVSTQEARTCPDLNEFEEFNLVRIYHAGNL